MNYSERAVKACVYAMKKGIISLRLVNNVLKCKKVDVSSIEPFLNDKNDFIRKHAVTIIGKKGDASLLVDLALKETSKQVMLNIMENLAGKKQALEKIVVLLESKDQVIRNSAIQMYKKEKRSDCLFILLFDDDDKLVQRIKKYIEDEDE